MHARPLAPDLEKWDPNTKWHETRSTMQVAVIVYCVPAAYIAWLRLRKLLLWVTALAPSGLLRQRHFILPDGNLIRLRTEVRRAETHSITRFLP